MGCLSFAAKLRVDSRRGLVSFGLVVALLSVLAVPSQAQSSRFGPRAGSDFTDALHRYGRISKRPYRRQTPSNVANSTASSKFDYRFDDAEASEVAEPASYDETDDGFPNDYFERHDVEQVGFCDCGDDCCCGSCVVEPGCGCVEYCEPGCGCDEYCEPGCGCDSGCYCEPGCGCDDCCGDCCCEPSCGCSGGRRGLLHGLGCGPAWSAGFEWSFVKPRYSDNVAFTFMDGDGANSSAFTETDFDYDLELTPRVWIEAATSNSWSWRVTYWQFDHSPATETISPGADGFDEVTHPSFGDVDISTTVPTDTFTASSSLNAYSLDFEALKQARLSGWLLGVGGGVRYASAEQGYFAQLRDNGNTLLGQIDFEHEIEGIGPTIFLSGKRPLVKRVQLVCAARGSLLFGEGTSLLVAEEDSNLANPFTTTRVTNRDDLLPIGEARVGLEWKTGRGRSGFQWLLSSAMEGQIWGNAGNAASQTGDLGFFGFNFGAGFLR